MNDVLLTENLLGRSFAQTHAHILGLTARNFDLPERVVQFGTGVLLRGLVDYVIDKANEAGVFNGSVVMIKSTEGPITVFTLQDNLYTVLEQGLQAGEITDRKHLVSCISRVLTAGADWNSILQCAADAAIDIVVSNTTEAGLVYVEERIGSEAPKSFPAKLTAYLWRRYQAFNGDPEKGMVILPCELRQNNGRLLKEFVLEHARYNDLPLEFIDWVRKCNVFCNTLVDRIVPGKTGNGDLVAWNREFGYADHLHVRTEPYLLWAIEANAYVASRLSFAGVDKRILISENIEAYEEQKLRILNGSNSLVALPAFLAGCDTLLDTVTDPLFASYTLRLIETEILPTIIDKCPNAPAFVTETLDRFRNPFVAYKLLNIALQCSSKINSRNGATIARFYGTFRRYPPLTMLGLASFFLYYTPKGRMDGAYYGLRSGEELYFFRDEHTEFISGVLENIDWLQEDQAKQAVAKILANDRIFSAELSSLPGLAATVAGYGIALRRYGIRNTIEKLLAIKQ